MSNSPSAHVVLRYNGYWCTFSRYNTPPERPSLHANWTWAADQASMAVRTQVGNHGF